MTITLALLHTTPVTVTALPPLARSELPGVRIVNLLDDSLLADVIAAGIVPSAVEERMAAYVAQAVALGATAVLCCCSTVGEAAERIGQRTPVPVWRIDSAMAEEAAKIGGRIAVLATLKTTLEPTVRLVHRAVAAFEEGAKKAEGQARSAPTVEACLVDDAFALLSKGDSAAHDALVAAALARIAERADVLVLAQASMARAASGLPRPLGIPLLTSPPLAFARARRLLGVPS